MSPLYKKLLLLFCTANLAVLLLSVFVTDRIGRTVYGNEPDWAELSAEAIAAYDAGSVLGLSQWAERQRRRGIDATLFLDGRDLLQRRRVAKAIAPFQRELLAEPDRLALRASDRHWLGSVRVTSARGEVMQFVALRGPPPPHERRALLLGVQIVLMLLLIAALGLWLARSLTRPIAAIQHATRKMADGDLSARADAHTTRRRDELGALARDFNHMAARTETLVGQQRTVLQDVSHELRSPLARLHLLLELARQGSSTQGMHQLDRAAKEVSRLDALIGEVLNLSRLESVLPGMATVPVAVDALVQDVVDEHALEAEARQIKISLETTPDLRAQGDAALLARALGNVLGNAIKFSPPQGHVSLGATRHGSEVVLSVQDTGPGVPSAQLTKLFQPFYRGDNAARAEGHGLGLAIAQRIVSAHGGRIVAENRAGGGLLVRLHLPFAQ